MRSPRPLLLTVALLTGTSLSPGAIARAQGTDPSPPIFLTNNGTSPVQMYSRSGTFLGSFGRTGATGVALDGLGHVWTVTPVGSNNSGWFNRFIEYDASQNILRQFDANYGNVRAHDMTFGPDNSLWVTTGAPSSATPPNVLNVDASTGALRSSFGVDAAIPGVAFDGTSLWLTGGLGDGQFSANTQNDRIFQYSLTGALLNTWHTGFVNGIGIGYTPFDNSFFVGYLDGAVRQFRYRPGDPRINGGFSLVSFFAAGTGEHDGLEVGFLGPTSVVPEPDTAVLLLTGLIGLCAAVRRTRSA